MAIGSAPADALDSPTSSIIHNNNINHQVQSDWKYIHCLIETLLRLLMQNMEI